MTDSATTKPATEPSEPKPAESETKPPTNADGPEADSENKEASTPETKSTVVGMASTAASTASAAASGVKDSVFSMFGGGARKEKKVEEEDEEARNEPSGSSKAQKKDADAEEVLIWIQSLTGFGHLEVSMPSTCLLLTYRKSSKPKMFILSLLFTSPRKSRLKPTKRQKTKLSRCERNYSNSTETQENGKNEAQEMCDY